MATEHVEHAHHLVHAHDGGKVHEHMMAHVHDNGHVRAPRHTHDGESEPAGMVLPHHHPPEEPGDGSDVGQALASKMYPMMG